MAVADLAGALDQFFPIREEGFSATVAVGTTVSQILPANPNRTQAVLVNFTSNQVSISRDPAVTTSNGIPIPPDRGVVILRKRDEGESIYGPWFVVASAAATTVGRTGFERATTRRVA